MTTNPTTCPKCGSEHTHFGYSHSDGEWDERGFYAQECTNRECGLPCRLWKGWSELTSQLAEAERERKQLRESLEGIAQCINDFEGTGLGDDRSTLQKLKAINADRLELSSRLTAETTAHAATRAQFAADWTELDNAFIAAGIAMHDGDYHKPHVEAVQELAESHAATRKELEEARAAAEELREKNTRLRRILAHVPARDAIKAKEAAGYGERVVPMSYAEIREQSTDENDVREI